MSVRVVRWERVACEGDPMDTMWLQFSEPQDWKARTTVVVIHDPQCGGSVLGVPGLISAGVIFNADSAERVMRETPNRAEANAEAESGTHNMSLRLWRRPSGQQYLSFAAALVCIRALRTLVPGSLLYTHLHCRFDPLFRISMSAAVANGPANYVSVDQ